MAMQVGELFATLTLDDSAFYRATASAQSALAALSRSLGALSGQGRSAEIHQFHRTPAQQQILRLQIQIKNGIRSCRMQMMYQMADLDSYGNRPCR